MTNDNRLLARKGARELTPREVDHVTGGIHTLTVCSFDETTHQPDGDVNEC